MWQPDDLNRELLALLQGFPKFPVLVVPVRDEEISLPEARRCRMVRDGEHYVMETKYEEFPGDVDGVVMMAFERELCRMGWNISHGNATTTVDFGIFGITA